jgi:hypothetical protein
MPPARQDGPEGQRLTGTMPVVDRDARAGAAARPSVDRRTLLVGAAGALATVGLSGSARAAGRAGSLAGRPGRRLDPPLARRLQRILNEAVHGPGGHAPGAILHVQSTALGNTSPASPGSPACRPPWRCAPPIASAPAAS